MIYDFGNVGSGIGQTQNFGGDKAVNGIPPLDSWICNININLAI
jgi:hypothetical protein